MGRLAVAGSYSRVWTVGVVVAALLAVVAPAEAAPLRPNQLTVVAGIGAAGFSGDGGPARDARIAAERISVGRDGSVYLSDGTRVRRVTPAGVIDTVYDAEDGLPYIETLTAVAVGQDGTLFVVTEVDYERRLLRIARGGGVTVLADQSKLGAATREAGEDDDVAVDAAGNAYLYNATTRRVVRVAPSGGVTPVGRAAVDVAAAQLAVSRTGTVYLAETGSLGGSGRSGSVYAIDATGPPRTVTTITDGAAAGPAVAADGTVYYIDHGLDQIMRIGKDGKVLAVSTRLDDIGDDLAVGPDGDLYVTFGDSSLGTSQILRLVQHGEPAPAEPAKPARSAWAGDEPGTVHTIAGTGRRPPATKKAPERPAEEKEGGGIAVGKDGTIYVAEPARNQVHAIAPDGTVRRFAGNGTSGEIEADFEDEAADEVVLNHPADVAAAPDGTVYLTANNRLYRVSTDGRISVVDIGRVQDSIDVPRLVATDAAGTVYYADFDSIQKLGADGPPVPVAGYDGLEEGPTPARQALLHDLRWLDAGADGTVYFVQRDGNAVQAVRPNGSLSTLAGGPGAGFTGDGGPASRATVNNALGVAAGPDGSRYIADTYNNRVRRVDARGVITTVAGNGQHADSGDGGPATKAALTDPTGVAVGADRTLYVVTATDLVRAVAPDGTIRTVADLDPDADRRATDISFDSLDSVAVGVDGTVYLASATGVHTIGRDGTLAPVAFDPPLLTFGKYGRYSPPGGAPLAAGQDGSLYLTPNAVLRLQPDGAVVPLLGGGMANRMADKPPADWSSPTEYTFREGDPQDIEVGPDGTVYLSTTTHGVYSVAPDGTLDTLLPAGERDLYDGIALDREGRLYVVEHLSTVSRVVDGKTEPVVGQYHAPEEPEPKFDTALTDPSDVAFTSDGSMFVSDGPEIRRFAPDGGVATAYHGDKGEVTELAVGPGDDLYFVEPDTDQVRVLVKAPRAPDLADTPAASAVLGWSIAGAVVVLIAAVIFVRRNRKRARPSIEAGT